MSLILASPEFSDGPCRFGVSPRCSSRPARRSFGVKINMFEVPFSARQSRLSSAPLMRNGDFFGLADQEVAIRMKRELFDKPRGSRGDALEGDMIMEGAIELENENHHTFVSGVTGWAKQT